MSGPLEQGIVTSARNAEATAKAAQKINYSATTESAAVYTELLQKT